MQLDKSKKGIGAMGNSLVIGIVVFTILLTIGATIISGVRDTQTTSGYAYNASTQGLAGIDKMSSFTTVIALAGIAVIVIGMIMGLQYMRGGQ